MDHRLALANQVLDEVVVALHLLLVENDDLAKRGRVEKAVAVLERREPTGPRLRRLSHLGRLAVLCSQTAVRRCLDVLLSRPHERDGLLRLADTLTESKLLF